MNWKKVGGVLVTLGVTASICYVAYSYKYVANSKDLESMKLSCSNCKVFHNLTEEESIRMTKNIHNLTKKQLNSILSLDSTEPKTNEQIDELYKLIKKWNFKNK